MPDVRPLVAVSLKMYLTAAATREYVARLAGMWQSLEPETRDAVEIAVLPTFPLLESTALSLGETGIVWGAQDVARSDDGAQTGEVGAGVLAELGCRYVEIGHAERRWLFGEGGDVLDDKLEQAARAGIVPLFCVGERQRREHPAGAARECLAELEHVLRVVPESPIVIAYEPVWAIGAPQPAPASYVGPVVSTLRDRLRTTHPMSRVIYGGAAGPGTFTDLADSADGLFLGRFAHDPAALAQVVQEVASATRAGTSLSQGGHNS